MLSKTELPDGRKYETYNNEYERNSRFNQLKNQGKKPEAGKYESMNGTIYFIIYKE